MTGNNEGELDKLCPFWQKPCSEVCPICPLYITISQQRPVLGVMKVVQMKMCYFPASAMIMSNKPMLVQELPSKLHGIGGN